VFLMTPCRNWTDRNTITHGGRFLETSSVICLESMCGTVLNLKYFRVDDFKGKKPHDSLSWNGDGDTTPTTPCKWLPPEEGWIKINVDSSFVEQTGQARAGVIIRGHLREVLVSTWRLLFYCSSAEEQRGIFSWDTNGQLELIVPHAYQQGTDCATWGRKDQDQDPT
jgi:hypothetical protein